MFLRSTTHLVLTCSKAVNQHHRIEATAISPCVYDDDNNNYNKFYVGLVHGDGISKAANEIHYR